MNDLEQRVKTRRLIAEPVNEKVYNIKKELDASAVLIVDILELQAMTDAKPKYTFDLLVNVKYDRLLNIYTNLQAS